jgi:type VI secretion system protein ImpJ
MNDLSRVVWHEGMHLAQHHFQVQNRYFEGAVHFALGHLFFRSYGLAGCELDAEALRNGTVALRHARGVLPDGLPFQIPDGDAPPPPLEIRERFSPTQDSHLVLLTIPRYRRDAANCVVDGGNGAHADTRFVAEPVPVMDEVSGRDQKPVTVGRKNFRLALDDGRRDTDVALPIARVRRDGSGSFVYDEEFVPPLLQIGASRWMVELLHRLVELLDGKSDAMVRARAATHPSLVEHASREIANFWLLHTVHASLAPLRHHLATRRAHPEQLYEEMVRLGGALCTFALDSHPRSLPAYDHDALGDCFAALERHIRAHLEIIAPTTAVRIALAAAGPSLFTGDVADRRCFGRARWVLGLRARAAPAEVITRAPQLVKVCSAKYTPELVRRAYPGLRLDHLPSPPAALSPRADTHYFLIGQAGPCWDTMVQSSAVGVYVPDAFPEAEPEIQVILEE